MRILVADDHSDGAETQAQLLRMSGHETHVCLHGNEVMEMVERIRPDAILLDLVMPGMDGFEVADELSHNTDLRPRLVVAVTGATDRATRDRTEQAGFDYYLAKPVYWPDLQSILARADRQSDGVGSQP
jgi:CheY-like chemotaxis protein